MGRLQNAGVFLYPCRAYGVLRDAFPLCFMSSSRAVSCRLQLRNVNDLAPISIILTMYALSSMSPKAYASSTVAIRAGPKLAERPLHRSIPLSEME